MEEKNALISQAEGLWREGLRSIVALWTESGTTIKSPRRGDLRRDKRRAIAAFFALSVFYLTERYQIKYEAQTRQEKDWMIDAAAGNTLKDLCIKYR